MKRISIIGNGGSGKSTFANKLGRLLNRPVIHLDKEFWLPGWKERFFEREDWLNHQRGMTLGESWIIDGDYRDGIAIRLEHADTVIFFDVPAWKCTLRVLKRTLNRAQPFDKAEGVKNKVSLGFIRYLFKYPYDEVRTLLGTYTDKRVYIIRNDKDSTVLLQKLNADQGSI
jgi:adenylate kinase family enzyme